MLYVLSLVMIIFFYEPVYPFIADVTDIDLSISDKMFCSYCNSDFTDREEQVCHSVLLILFVDQ